MHYNNQKRHWEKVSIKNNIIFRKKLLGDGELRERLILLTQHYHKDPTSAVSFVYALLDPKRNFGLQTQVIWDEYFYRDLDIIEKFDAEKGLALFEDSKELVARFNFGNEWEDAFIVFLVTGKLYPPYENLNIQLNPTQKNLVLTRDRKVVMSEKRVNIELNHDTSLEDIEYAVDSIKALQKKVRPIGFHKSNITKNSWDMFKKTIEHLLGKIALAKEEELAKLTTVYEEAIWKQHPEKEAIKLINSYRRKKHLPKIFKLPKKMSTDKELVLAQNSSKKGKESDIKREINKIRQQRHRLKGKMTTL